MSKSLSSLSTTQSLTETLLLQLHEPDLALAYCDRVYAPTNPGMHPNTASLASLAFRPHPKDPAAANIYLTLLEVYLKPKAAIQEFDRSIASLAPVRNTINQRTTAMPRTKGAKKIAQIEDGKRSAFFLSFLVIGFPIMPYELLAFIFPMSLPHRALALHHVLPLPWPS